MRNDELYHYGVKGMKWRFRRSGRKELGEETLEERYSRNSAKNSIQSYKISEENGNPDGKRILDTAQAYRSMYNPVGKRKKIVKRRRPSSR